MLPDEIAKLSYRPCVGVMLLNATGEVFVGERIDTPGAWQMPQGGIDMGEEPQAAALRELSEETGLQSEKVAIESETPGWITYDLPFEMVPKRWGGRFRGQKQKWFLMRFLGIDSDVNIDTDHPEFLSWRWMPQNDLIHHIVPFKRTVYAKVLRAFEGQK